MAERLDSVPDSSYNSDEEDDEIDYYYQQDSYEPGEEELNEMAANVDPEYYEYKCLSKYDDIVRYVDERSDKLRSFRKMSLPAARQLLCKEEWSIEKALKRLQELPSPPTELTFISDACPACLGTDSKMITSECGHTYCEQCWRDYIEVQVKSGKAVDIECMTCSRWLKPEMVEELVVGIKGISEKMRKFTLEEYVKDHPCLRWCGGAGCEVAFQVNKPQMKRVVCNKCNCSFCFKCGESYHCPTDCDTIKKWFSKCNDDSETAHYISANTKSCPNEKCSTNIEKNGGCNHMRCSKCHHEFCWMCMGPWNRHATEYYECSKYKNDPDKFEKSSMSQARSALKKYLHYYGRWDNHDKSLQLEQELLQQLNEKITAKVNEGKSSWIDWQFLLDAARQLTKCRYTLKYTYPLAYYLEGGPRKALFEYQQAQLEREIENLSWKVERTDLEAADVADLQQQMRITEVQRQNLLRDFFV